MNEAQLRGIRKMAEVVSMPARADGQRTLPMANVRPNPNQPRKAFDPATLQELADSIVKNGLLQPITVVPVAATGDVPGHYMIVAGERRWRAHQLAGIERIAVNVVEMDADAVAVNAIIENLQRADITPLEEARAFRRMCDAGYSPEDLAERLGLRQPWRVTDRLRLLTLTPTLLDLFEKGHLGSSEATELSRQDADGQRALFELIKTGRCESYAKLRAASDGLLAAKAQAQMFDLPPPPTDEERAQLTRVERLIENLVRLCNEGIQENDVVLVKKVNPDRAAVLVQQLGLIRKDLEKFEKALQHAAVQGALGV